MPGFDGQCILFFERDPQHRMGEALLDGNLDHAYALLSACIESSAPGMDDPTKGVWYCERLTR